MQNLFNMKIPFTDSDGNLVTEGRVHFLALGSDSEYIDVYDIDGDPVENPMPIGDDGWFQTQPFAKDGVDFHVRVERYAGYADEEGNEVYETVAEWDVCAERLSFDIDGLPTFDCVDDLAAVHGSTDSEVTEDLGSGVGPAVLVLGFWEAGDFCPPRVFKWQDGDFGLGGDVGCSIDGALVVQGSAPASKGAWVISHEGELDVRWAGVEPDVEKQSEYSVTVTYSDGGTVTADVTDEVAAGTTVTLTVTPETGYSVSGLTSSNVTLVSGGTDTDGVATYTFTMPRHDATVAAEFEIVTYSLTLNVGNYSAASVSADAANYGDEVTIAVSYDTGCSGHVSVSAGTLTNNGDGTYTLTMPAEDVTVTVTGYRIAYVLVLDGDNVELSATTAHYGDEVTISPAAGYSLTSVSVSAGTLTENSDGTWTLTMPASGVSITATADVIDYTVTLDGDNVELSAATAHYGDEVTISPVTGYSLASVSVSAGTLTENSDGTWTLTMPAEDVTVTAAADVIDYTVTLDGDNVELSAATAHYGDEVTISPVTGYSLASVSVSAGTLTENSDGTWTLTMPAEDVTVTAAAEPLVATLDVSLGDITLTSTGYTAEGATEETAWSGAYVITGTTTEYSVSVTSGDLEVTLSSVDVELSDGSSTDNLGTAAFSVSEEASVSLTLEGENTLSSGYGKAGLECSGATVSIGGDGSLAATGGSNGAGIGGGRGTTGGDGGTVTISGTATVTATGGNSGAGIGGGYGTTTGGNGGTVTISDSATVTATGSYGAGIGGGRGTTGGDGGTVTISGTATVTATGGTYGAGIGGGYGTTTGGNGGTVTISDSATVTATGSNGAGIGSGGYGHGASGGSLSISDFAVVTAKNTGYGAAVGGGYGYSTSYTGNDGADVTITGGFLFAFVSGGSSTYSAAAIGGGAGRGGASYGGASGTFTQTGGIVLAQTRYTVSDCIGNATGGSGDVPDIASVSGGMVITYQGSSTAKTSWDMTDAANIANGAITLASDSVWPEGYTLTIDEGETLTIMSGCTLLCQGTITNAGTLDGTVDNQGTLN